MFISLLDELLNVWAFLVLKINEEQENEFIINRRDNSDKTSIRTTNERIDETIDKIGTSKKKLNSNMICSKVSREFILKKVL